MLLALAGVAPARDDAGSLIKQGREDAEHARWADAESSFARAARTAGNDETRREAQFRQAAIIRSGADAEALYRSIMDDGARDEWSEKAAVELGKIEFATGRYEGAFATFTGAEACANSEEACLLGGLAAIMSHDYEAALVQLERARRGRQRTWAAVASAEALAASGRRDEACASYASLAGSRSSAVAWYRFAECLEAAGDRERARREFAALEDAFPQTPEAVRAAGKRDESPAPAPAPVATAEDRKPAGPGFTLQFGSFDDRTNAIRLQARIKEEYPNVRIDSELVNFREVFRVRYGHYADRETARAAGEQMTRRINERYTIMPVAGGQ